YSTRSDPATETAFLTNSNPGISSVMKWNKLDRSKTFNLTSKISMIEVET
ncbi:23486_t:CDS:2, partial [Gigaspora rosea]